MFSTGFLRQAFWPDLAKLWGIGVVGQLVKGFVDLVDGQVAVGESCVIDAGR